MSSHERIGSADASERFANWPSLPAELLEAVSHRLTSIYDYLAFRSVCTSWRCAAPFNNFDRSVPRVPWLTYLAGGDTNGGAVHLFDRSSERIFRIVDFLPVPVVRYLSSGGWILYIRPYPRAVILTHPTRCATIELPGLHTFPTYGEEDAASDRFLKKLILSGSPAIDPDCTAVVIWGKGKQNRLGFSRPGDSAWCAITSSLDYSFCDATFHNGKLYALDITTRIVQLDIRGSNPTPIQEVFTLLNTSNLVSYQVPLYSSRYTCYLVASLPGKLLLVIRWFSVRGLVRFEIYELDVGSGSSVRVLNLGSRALFLGLSSSLCIDLSGHAAVQPNCIYFTDSIQYGFADAAMYSLLDDTVARFSHCPAARATWVVPCF